MATAKVQIVVIGAAKDDMVYEIPHDFENPMAAVKLGSQLTKYGETQARVLDVQPTAAVPTGPQPVARSRK